MKRKICKLLGHKVKFYDAQYPVCDRCGAHAYYDDLDYRFEWHYWPYRWLIKLQWRLHNWNQIRKERRPVRDDEIPF